MAVGLIVSCESLVSTLSLGATPRLMFPPIVGHWPWIMSELLLDPDTTTTCGPVVVSRPRLLSLSAAAGGCVILVVVLLVVLVPGQKDGGGGAAPEVRHGAVTCDGAGCRLQCDTGYVPSAPGGGGYATSPAVDRETRIGDWTCRETVALVIGGARHAGRAWRQRIKLEPFLLSLSRSEFAFCFYPFLFSLCVLLLPFAVQPLLLPFAVEHFPLNL